MASTVTDQFSGKVVIVTGSSSGIGEVIALTFAKRGAKVTLCGRDVTRLEKVKDKCVAVSGGHSGRFLTVSGDLRDKETRNQVVNNTLAQFGQLDILVCNAGVSDAEGTINDAKEESFDFIFDINVKSVFFLIQTALPYLEQYKGNIVITSSFLSKVPCSPVIIYPMSKAAIDHMVNCLALDLAPRGIRVNSVNPPFVNTRIARGREKGNEAYLQQIAETVEKIEAAKHPLEKRNVTLEEISEAVAFLASDKASFITGQHLFVDGGRMLNGPMAFERTNLNL